MAANMPKFNYIVAAAGALLLSPGVQAEPRFAQMYKQHAGYMPSCNACHLDGGGSDLNAYGEAFKQAGSGMAAFAKLAKQDADADQHDNASEVAARANPGDRRSTPKAPGDWLDTANVIPRDVQKLFPGVTRYKPLDAILTEQELARARSMGVELSKQDETTIYIPVEGGKAIGTAVIAPVRYQDKQFFVVLATDRQLQVTQARAMHASSVVGAQESVALRQVQGLSVDQLPAGEGDGLDAAILSGLRKAGALLYLRLKGQ